MDGQRCEICRTMVGSLMESSAASRNALLSTIDKLITQRVRFEKALERARDVPDGHRVHRQLLGAVAPVEKSEQIGFLVRQCATHERRDDRRGTPASYPEPAPHRTLMQWRAVDVQPHLRSHLDRQALPVCRLHSGRAHVPARHLGFRLEHDAPARLALQLEVLIRVLLIERVKRFFHPA
jgi:hypothetical protein